MLLRVDVFSRLGFLPRTSVQLTSRPRASQADPMMVGRFWLSGINICVPNEIRCVWTGWLAAELMLYGMVVVAIANVRCYPCFYCDCNLTQ